MVMMHSMFRSIVVLGLATISISTMHNRTHSRFKHCNKVIMLLRPQLRDKERSCCRLPRKGKSIYRLRLKIRPERLSISRPPIQTMIRQPIVSTQIPWTLQRVPWIKAGRSSACKLGLLLTRLVENGKRHFVICMSQDLSSLTLVEAVDNETSASCHRLYCRKLRENAPPVVESGTKPGSERKAGGCVDWSEMWYRPVERVRRRVLLPRYLIGASQIHFWGALAQKAICKTRRI